jgi:cell wall-associated NlpC family hydrolase
MVFFFLLIMITGCNGILDAGPESAFNNTDSLKSTITDQGDTNITKKKDDVKIKKDTLLTRQILEDNIPVDSIINFATSLIGIPYKYGSIDPDSGFDCSGFITYVYNHFNIKVPRSSIDFTNAGREIPVADSKKGDLILFRGTDSTERFVGHMGIIVSNNNGNIEFIHSTSGKAYGVTITPLNEYYMKRFVKVIESPI